MLRNITCTDDSADLPFIANELLQLRLREIAFAQTRAAHNHRIFKIQHPRTVRHSLNFCGDLHAVHYFRRRRILVKMCDDEAVTPRLGTFRHCNVHVPLQLQGGRVTVRTGGGRTAQHPVRMFVANCPKRPFDAIGVGKCIPLLRTDVVALLRHDNHAGMYTTLACTAILRLLGYRKTAVRIGLTEHRV